MIIAHGIGGRSDLPIPLALLTSGAVVVLVITFLGLALLWPSPRLQDGPRPPAGRGAPLPMGVLLAGMGMVGLVLVVGQIIPSLIGLERVSTRATIAPVLVWVVFWLVVPFGGAVLGDWYSALNPWRALARVFRIGRSTRASAFGRWGVWPATLGLLGFTWLELVSTVSSDPVALGAIALAFSVCLLTTMAFVGVDAASIGLDPFTSYNRVISAIAPVGRSKNGKPYWRGWLRALPVLPEWPGLWAFVVVMIGTVSYDGVSGSSWFATLTGGLGGSTAGRTALLVLTVVIIGAAFYGCCALAASMAGGGAKPGQVAQRFAHTLVPVALAYALSHYFTLIIFEGQQVVAALSDPFGLGWDLFGTADLRVTYFITSSTPVWLLQVGFIVGGHLVGVVLAHDRSLQDFGADAVRSQYAMLVLMIALTSLGLLILSG